MNTSKHNFESEIKKQIEEREIHPSRDLWAEIELQNGNSGHSKPRASWLLIAACLVLTVSLSAVLFFNKETPTAEPQIAKHTVPVNNGNLVTSEKMTSNKPLKVNVLTVEADKNVTFKQQETVHSPLLDKEHQIVTLEKPLYTEPEIIPADPVKVIASIDSSKVPVKKKRFVDPSTLLFSVEHKDVIEKTKEGSNVATINLNSQ